MSGEPTCGSQGGTACATAFAGLAVTAGPPPFTCEVTRLFTECHSPIPRGESGGAGRGLPGPRAGRAGGLTPGPGSQTRVPVPLEGDQPSSRASAGPGWAAVPRLLGRQAWPAPRPGRPHQRGSPSPGLLTHLRVPCGYLTGDKGFLLSSAGTPGAGQGALSTEAAGSAVFVDLSQEPTQEDLGRLPARST